MSQYKFMRRLIDPDHRRYVRAPEVLKELGGDPANDLPRLMEATEVLDSRDLYRAIMQYRDVNPTFFPVDDVQVLTANALSDFEAIRLLDLQLLPAAILLAGAGKRIGLPADHAKLASILKKWLPEAQWEDADAKLPILGMLAFNQQLRESAKNGGLLITNPGFLSSKSDIRPRHLLAGYVASVLQLPRPKRQKNPEIPVLMLLEKPGHSQTHIRFALLNETHLFNPLRFGELGVSLPLSLSMLLGPEPTPSTIEIDRQKLALADWSLSPMFWLGDGVEVAPGTPRLVDFAYVIRCQVSRRRVGQEAACEPDGEGYIVREIVQADLDDLTGCLKAAGGKKVWARLDEYGRGGQHLLRSGDIIFAYRGSEQSIGACGYVDEPGEPAIVASNFYIIRPKLQKMAPWLYYTLRKPESVKRIMAKSTVSGGRLITINIEDVRSLPMARPEEDEMEKCAKLRTQLGEHLRVITAQRESIANLLAENGMKID